MLLVALVRAGAHNLACLPAPKIHSKESRHHCIPTYRHITSSINGSAMASYMYAYAHVSSNLLMLLCSKCLA